VFSDEFRAKRSIISANYMRTQKEHAYTSGRGGKRADLGMQYFRSRWEANFARVLNLWNVKWEYEPEQIALSCQKTYIPDFVCEGVYYEVKGWMKPIDKLKIDTFMKDHPEKTLVVIDEFVYRRLMHDFKRIIPEWEENK